MMDEYELESLLHSLYDIDPEVRRRAIHKLGSQQSTRAMMGLKDIVLKDSDLSCQKAALYWLQRTADQSIFNKALRYALSNDDPFLRLDAAWNICQSRKPNPEIVEPLIHALDYQDIAMGMIMAALGKLRDQRAFEPLVAYLRSANSHYRGVAAQALGELGDQRAIEPLTTLLDDQAVAWEEDHGPEVRVATIAQKALRQLKSNSG